MSRQLKLAVVFFAATAVLGVGYVCVTTISANHLRLTKPQAQACTVYGQSAPVVATFYNGAVPVSTTAMRDKEGWADRYDDGTNTYEITLSANGRAIQNEWWGADGDGENGYVTPNNLVGVSVEFPQGTPC